MSSRPAVRFEPWPDGFAHLVLDRPDDAVNAIDPGFIDDLDETLDEAAQAPDLQGLILWSAKPEQFIGGADLGLILEAESYLEITRAARSLQRALRRLEGLPIPSVAAIGGPALGGGLEVALACDWRVGARTGAVSLGQPEVALGLIPAAGGTQRLPRLVGLPRALSLILSGRRLNVRQAQRLGLLDLAVHPSALRTAAVALARRGKRRVGPRRAISKVAQRLLIEQARRRVLRETGGHYPAPLLALSCIRIGLEKGAAAGLEAEARAFAELAAGPTARNLIRLFMHGRHLAKEPPGAEARPIERLGVVGAGFMGAGLAEVAAAAGLRVRLRDLDHQALARGLSSIRELVGGAAARGVFEGSEARTIVDRVSGTIDYSGFERVQIAIEAVFEDLEVKRRVVAELEEALPREAIIASNTSALPIGAIAQGARHPERVVGLHFFSPVHKMRLLEVVRWEGGADWALATALELARRLGKTPIVVGDGPGFYTTRALAAMVNEAGLLLEEGARIEEVDGAMVRFGFPVGPFALLDELGLEVAADVARTLGTAGQAPAARAIPALVEAGRRGRRGGAGFYRYLDGRRRRDPEVYRLLGTEPRAVAWRAIQERLALAFVNEAARCLEEGVLASPADGDVGAVLGVGFPPFLGGPFRYADGLGLPWLRDRLAALSERHGPRYRPSALLETETAFYP